MISKLIKTGLITVTIARLGLALLLLATFGCANTKYSQDYRPATDFSSLTTYNWRNISSEIPGITAEQLQRIDDPQLLEQGYTRTDSNPDFLIDLTVVTRVSTGSSTGLGLSIGLPVGRHGSIGVGGGKSLPNDKEEGVILVDITKSQTNALIWRGSAEGIPMENFSLRAESKLAAVLDKLFKQFPPK